MSGHIPNPPPPPSGSVRAKKAINSSRSSTYRAVTAALSKWLFAHVRRLLHSGRMSKHPAMGAANSVVADVGQFAICAQQAPVDNWSRRS
jgi:hypothetical protein